PFAVGASTPTRELVSSTVLRVQLASPTPYCRPPLPAPGRARNRRRGPPTALGAGGVTSIGTALFRAAIELVLDLTQQLAPPWLLPSRPANTHGTSRWARRSERSRLGRSASPERMHG